MQMKLKFLIFFIMRSQRAPSVTPSENSLIVSICPLECYSYVYTFYLPLPKLKTGGMFY